MSGQSDIAAVILAAGQSTRFGANKLLTETCINNTSQSLLWHTLSSWLDCFDQLSVVVPELDSSITACCQSISKNIQIVPSPLSAQGMGHSLASGVAANIECSGWVIGLADMPLISAEVLTGLRDALMAGADIVAPYHGAKRGNPVGFSSRYKQALLSCKGDVGAKDIIRHNEKNVHKLMIHSNSILIDIDYKSDLNNL